MPSLLEALEQKYGNESSTESETSEEELCVSIFVPARPPRVIVPSLLVLNDCDITTAGEREALVDKCAAVEELDLAKNKLNCWPEVFGILQQMPRLKFVNLSFNQLSMPLMETQVNTDFKWTNLKNLVLNSTGIDWASVQKILQYSPTLEELHLSMNEYKEVNLCDDKDCSCQQQEQTNDCQTQDGETNDCQIQPDEQTNVCQTQQEEQTNVCQTEQDEQANNCQQGEDCSCSCSKSDYKKKHKHLGVKKLHFTGNHVDKWQEVCKLGYAFPNLEYLVLANCPIETLDLENANVEVKHDYDHGRTESECESESGRESPHDGFRQLKFLNLNSTQLSTWDELERLAKFPALQCLRLQGCPLWDSSEYTEHERRQLVIARLPNVEMLNGGGVIDHDEREDAERAFIRYYMDKPESDRPDRYFELVSIHGKLDPLVNVDLRPEKRVKVTFTCGANSEVRSVDVYRTVQDLKTKLEQFAGFSASKMRLFYVDQYLRDIQGPEEMRYPHKQLYSYNISSGDEIIIDCKKKPSESRA